MDAPAFLLTASVCPSATSLRRARRFFSHEGLPHCSRACVQSLAVSSWRGHQSWRSKRFVTQRRATLTPLRELHGERVDRVAVAQRVGKDGASRRAWTSVARPSRDPRNGVWMLVEFVPLLPLPASAHSAWPPLITAS